MSHRNVHIETARLKRQLRSAIARSRGQTAGDLAALANEGMALTSWRTYARKFPVAMLASAFAVGLMVAAGRPMRRVPRLVGSSLLNWGLATAKGALLGELSTLLFKLRSSAETSHDIP